MCPSRKAKLIGQLKSQRPAGGALLVLLSGCEVRFVRKKIACPAGRCCCKEKSPRFGAEPDWGTRRSRETERHPLVLTRSPL